MQENELPGLEYAALRSEERDRINARLTIWTIFLSLVGVFGFASLQNSEAVYLLAVFPGLVACLAAHTRHSEDVLRSIRKYLYQLEQECDYKGYEHFTRTTPRPTHGGYLDALRAAFVLSQALATGLLLYHLVTDHVALVIIVLVFVVEMVPPALTGWFLSKHRSKKP